MKRGKWLDDATAPAGFLRARASTRTLPTDRVEREIATVQESPVDETADESGARQPLETCRYGDASVIVGGDAGGEHDDPGVAIWRDKTARWR